MLLIAYNGLVYLSSANGQLRFFSLIACLSVVFARVLESDDMQSSIAVEIPPYRDAKARARSASPPLAVAKEEDAMLPDEAEALARGLSPDSTRSLTPVEVLEGNTMAPLEEALDADTPPAPVRRKRLSKKDKAKAAETTPPDSLPLASKDDDLLRSAMRTYVRANG